MNLPENINFLFDYDNFISYNKFFVMNNLLDKKYEGCTFVLYGSKDYPITLKLEHTTNNMTSIIYINNDRVGEEGEEYKNKDVSSLIFEQPTQFFGTTSQERMGVSKWEKCHIVKLIIIIPDEEPRVYEREETSGGRKASVKKEICGRMRCIYKIQGSRKEHIKYKGRLITVADYKKLMKKA